MSEPEPNFEIIEVEDYHPTQLGCDDGEPIDDSYVKRLYETHFTKFLDDSQRESNPINNLVEEQKSTERKLRIARELEELKGLPDIDYAGQRGTGGVYWSIERSKRKNLLA